MMNLLEQLQQTVNTIRQAIADGKITPSEALTITIEVLRLVRELMEYIRTFKQLP